MNYLVLAYPKWEPGAYQRIQDFRQEHDGLHYEMVEPHFTLVFAVEGISRDECIREMRQKSEGAGPFDFVLRCATVNKDAFRPWYHVFLIPEEGYSRLVKLHDALYDGLLRPHLRTDLDYIPHIGVGNAPDPVRCRQLAGIWNSTEFEIRGSVTHITLVASHEQAITRLDECAL